MEEKEKYEYYRLNRFRTAHTAIESISIVISKVIGKINHSLAKS